MNDVSDDMLIKVFKLLCTIVPSMAAFLDMLILTDVRMLCGYIFLRYWKTPSLNAKVGYAVASLFLCLFILVLCIQTRLEKDRSRFQEEVYYKISTIRWLAIMVLINLPLLIGITLYPHIFDMKYASAVTYTTITGICPCIFIYNHNGMLELSQSSLSKWKALIRGLVKPEAPYAI